MRAPEPWSVLAGILVPVSFDLLLEPWRIGPFILACILFAFPVFLIWSAANGSLKE